MISLFLKLEYKSKVMVISILVSSYEILYELPALINYGDFIKRNLDIAIQESDKVYHIQYIKMLTMSGDDQDAENSLLQAGLAEDLRINFAQTI